MIPKIKTVHPFPARMAPSIVWDKLPDSSKSLKILDPMSGSGTTLAIARSKGHRVYGVDRDPLAITISKAWCYSMDTEKLRSKANEVLEKAKLTAKFLNSKMAFPANSDDKTKEFIKYWFDLKGRKQLAALSKHIALTRDKALRVFLWTAFSRMIITKKVGVSLAMDISHSRPHKVYAKAPVTPFEIFLKAIERVIKANLFPISGKKHPKATISYGDSRKLSFRNNFFDLVITSPPYLSAIDYLRGHKLSLVWMKSSLEKIKLLRATNIGTEVQGILPDKEYIVSAIESSGTIDELTSRQKGSLIKYVLDMDSVCSEVKRVLKPGGKAIYVVGDCTIKGIFISNSNVIRSLSEHHGLKLENIEERPLQENRRYLPPPSNNSSGKQLKRRMRKEVILVMRKAIN